MRTAFLPAMIFVLRAAAADAACPPVDPTCPVPPDQPATWFGIGENGSVGDCMQEWTLTWRDAYPMTSPSGGACWQCPYSGIPPYSGPLRAGRPADDLKSDQERHQLAGKQSCCRGDTTCDVGADPDADYCTFDLGMCFCVDDPSIATRCSPTRATWCNAVPASPDVLNGTGLETGVKWAIEKPKKENARRCYRKVNCDVQGRNCEAYLRQPASCLNDDTQCRQCAGCEQDVCLVHPSKLWKQEALEDLRAAIAPVYPPTDHPIVGSKEDVFLIGGVGESMCHTEPAGDCVTSTDHLFPKKADPALEPACVEGALIRVKVGKSLKIQGHFYPDAPGDIGSPTHVDLNADQIILTCRRPGVQGCLPYP